MKRSAKQKQPKAPAVISIADSGPNWRIEFDPSTRDYTAIMVALDFENPLGSRRFQFQARQLITEHLCPDAS